MSTHGTLQQSGSPDADGQTLPLVFVLFSWQTEAPAGFSAALSVSSRLFWWPFGAKDAHGGQQRHQGERSEERGHSLRRMGL